MLKLIKYFFVLGLLPFVSINLNSQEYALDQKSPQSTVFKHLYYLQDGNYNPEKAGEVFESATENNSNLAIELKQVFDARGHFIELAEIPSDSAFIDSSSNQHKYIPISEYPNIYVVLNNGKWQYSNKSIIAIKAMHKSIFPFGTAKLMNMFPKLGNKTFLGLKAWQYVGILLLFILIFILHKLFTFLIDRIVQRLIQSDRVSSSFRDAIHKMSIPISYLALVQVIDWLSPSLMFPIGIAHYLALAFKIVEPIFLTIALYRLADVISLIFMRRAEKTETSLDDQLVPLFRKSLKAFVLIFGLIVLLNNLEFNLTALIAGASIGGLAFALAAQDTIKNLFGSLMIFIDRPFQIGDLVALEGATGTIEEVGFRSTRIRTPMNSLVSVPNGKVVDMVIDNLGMRVYRRYQTSISLTYDTPVDLIETYVQGLRQIILMHPKTRKDSFEVYLNDMAPSSLNILMNVFFIDEGWSAELKGRHEVISEAIRLAELLKIRFAFPTQTLHIETMPDKTIPDFGYPIETKTREEILDNYFVSLKQRMVAGNSDNDEL
jgi:MscS family membrane protein